MARARLVFAMVLVAAVLPAQASAKKFHFTHKVTVTGSFVDHWTAASSTACNPVGDGTLTVSFHLKGPAFASPQISPFAGPHGRWVVLAPFEHHLADLPPRPADATISRVDNTTLLTTADEPCSGETLDKSSCGTSILRHAKIDVEGIDRSRLASSLISNDFRDPKGNCMTGSAEGFTQPPNVVGGLGGNSFNAGAMRLKMPRPSTLKHKHVVTVTATDHTHSSSQAGGDQTVTDDVTRTITVTFTRL
ncbi:MAG TPA: hypothetical protein VGI67_20625 [Thermoleophilaceae bacterium]